MLWLGGNIEIPEHELFARHLPVYQRLDPHSPPWRYSTVKPVTDFLGTDRLAGELLQSPGHLGLVAINEVDGLLHGNVHEHKLLQRKIVASTNAFCNQCDKIICMLSDQVKRAREARGWSQPELARRIGGISPQSIQQLEAGEVKQPRYMERLIAVLPEVDPYRKPYGQGKSVDFSHVEVQRLVPLISWVEAGDWHMAEDVYEPGDGEAMYPSPVKTSPSAYALRVRGDSMTAPQGRSYPDGTIIVVDPEQRGAVTSGDRVIAKVEGEDLVTFKVYVTDGSRHYLKPLNSQYPLIDTPFRILGKVVGGWVD